MANTY